MGQDPSTPSSPDRPNAQGEGEREPPKSASSPGSGADLDFDDPEDEADDPPARMQRTMVVAPPSQEDFAGAAGAPRSPIDDLDFDDGDDDEVPIQRTMKVAPVSLEEQLAASQEEPGPVLHSALTQVADADEDDAPIPLDPGADVSPSALTQVADADEDEEPVSLDPFDAVSPSALTQVADLDGREEEEADLGERTVPLSLDIPAPEDPSAATAPIAEPQFAAELVPLDRSGLAPAGSSGAPMPGAEEVGADTEPEDDIEIDELRPDPPPAVAVGATASGAGSDEESRDELDISGETERPVFEPIGTVAPPLGAPPLGPPPASGFAPPLAPASGFGPPPPPASGFGPPPAAPGFAPRPAGKPPAFIPPPTPIAGFAAPPPPAAGFGAPPPAATGFGPPPQAPAGFGPPPPTEPQFAPLPPVSESREEPAPASAGAPSAPPPPSPLDLPALARIAAKNALKPKYQFKRWVLIRKIDNGSRSTVWLAWDRPGHFPVVVKVVSKKRYPDAQSRERFIRDVTKASSLRHPVIVPVTEVGEVHDGMAYIVTGFADGETLRHHLFRRGILPRDVATIARYVAMALNYAHETGVIHGGLRPENIFVDRSLRPALTDFGLVHSHLDDAIVGRTSREVATSLYIAPEQVDAGGRPVVVDARTDVFALGAILYEALTGFPAFPFEGAPTPGAIAEALRADPLPLRARNAEISEKLADLVTRCIARDPTARPATLNAFAGELCALPPETGEIAVRSQASTARSQPKAAVRLRSAHSARFKVADFKAPASAGTPAGAPTAASTATPATKADADAERRAKAAAELGVPVTSEEGGMFEFAESGIQLAPDAPSLEVSDDDAPLPTGDITAALIASLPKRSESGRMLVPDRTASGRIAVRTPSGRVVRPPTGQWNLGQIEGLKPDAPPSATGSSASLRPLTRAGSGRASKQPAKLSRAALSLSLLVLFGGAIAGAWILKPSFTGRGAADTVVRVSVQRPADGSILRAPVDIVANAVTGSPRELIVGSRRVPVQNGNFQARLPLIEGEHAIELPIPGAANQVLGTFTVDNTPPRVIVSSPTAGAILTDRKVAVVGKVSDLRLESFTIRGEAVAVGEDGAFRTEVTLAAGPGAKKLLLEAKDAAGNVDRSEIEVFLDEEAPVIELAEPAVGAAVHEKAVAVRGKVREDVFPGRARVRVNGLAVPISDEGEFETEVELDEDGSHEIRVEVTDGAGREAEPVRRLLVLDTVAPEIVLDEPVDGFRTRNFSVPVRGHVDDSRREGLRVRIGTLLAEVDAEGNFATTIAVTREGENVVTATAIDEAGNTSFARARVYRDSTPPKVRVSEMTVIETSRGARLNVVGSLDERGCTLEIGGNRVELESDTFRVQLPLAPGVNRLEFTASDALGNSVVVERVIEYGADGSDASDAVGREGAEPSAGAGGSPPVPLPSELEMPKRLLTDAMWWTPAEEQKAYAERTGKPLWFENSLGMRFVLIPPGRFIQGSPTTELGRKIDEEQRRIEVESHYYLCVTEVTNAQMRQFMPGHRSGDWGELGSLEAGLQPAVVLKWGNANAFARWLNQKEGHGLYRLPIDMEWEYACRAGQAGRWFWGEKPELAAKFANLLDERTRVLLGWQSESFPGDDGHRVTAPVASYEPNGFGLFDMIGNVLEWTRISPHLDEHLLRGGSWRASPDDSRAARRLTRAPSVCSGVRLLAPDVPPDARVP